ncbi:MAG: phosphoribosylformylglycinamidine synthase subunit PurQ [Candidatus Cloacimonetes bacterium]|nr:phosphoribosylformylglycinamidine synthase subunit PurQ [Candidatus Cloacimonadota bacterium]
MKYSIITFPGSNCDYDSYYVAKQRGNIVNQIWHKDTDLKNPDVVILPGGFSYGDYLRCGVIARFSPIIKEVTKFAEKGGLVIGICNGFQILTECGLLPGALMLNRDLQFICQHQHLKVINANTPFTNQTRQDEVLDLPIAHKEGNYYIDNDGLKRLQDNNQIVLRYCNADGSIDEHSNPNGALNDIAGIINDQGNVFGLMPHPERNADVYCQSPDGAKIFDSIEKSILQNR